MFELLIFKCFFISYSLRLLNTLLLNYNLILESNEFIFVLRQDFIILISDFW